MGGARPSFAAGRNEVCPLDNGFRVNPKWGLWCSTDGEKGEEPPEEIKWLYKLSKEGIAEHDEQKRILIEMEIHLINADNLWQISAVNLPSEAYPILISNRIRNVRKTTMPEFTPVQPSTWFFEE